MLLLAMVSAVVESSVRIHGMAVGGEGVARLADGRVVFVAGTVTGDSVTVDVTQDKKRYARGRVASVVEASAMRIEPECEAVERGCGGCDWQHIAAPFRGSLLTDLVDDVLRRLGGVDDPNSRIGGRVPDSAYRTTLRLTVENGRTGFRARRSNDLVAVDACGVAAPELADLIAAQWPGADELTLRCGRRTGDRLAIVSPTCPDDVDVADDVIVVGCDELSSGRRAWVWEEAAGRRWRISADSFFQSSPEAAELLVQAVGDLVPDELASSRHVLDLYGGVGLFTGALARAAPDATWTLVESARSSVADARENLADTDANIVSARVENFSAPPSDVVIADPPRTGLSKAGVKTVVSCGAPALVLVSCDLGSMGRDVGLLRRSGYQWRESVILDIFPQTSHTEVVTLMHKVE